jgi:hypothetical protein
MLEPLGMVLYSLDCLGKCAAVLLTIKVHRSGEHAPPCSIRHPSPPSMINNFPAPINAPISEKNHARAVARPPTRHVRRRTPLRAAHVREHSKRTGKKLESHTRRHPVRAYY